MVLLLSVLQNTCIAVFLFEKHCEIVDVQLYYHTRVRTYVCIYVRKAFFALYPLKSIFHNASKLHFESSFGEQKTHQATNNA